MAFTRSAFTRSAFTRSAGAVPEQLGFDGISVAEHHYAGAEAAMAACPRRPMRTAATMLAVYRAILRKLVERGWTELDRPVRLAKLQKAARALAEAESGLSERRRGVQQVMDALAAELGRRYRDGEADVAALLADEGRH